MYHDVEASRDSSEPASDICRFDLYVSLAIGQMCRKTSFILVTIVSSSSVVYFAKLEEERTACGWSCPAPPGWESATPCICTPSCKIGQLGNC